MATIRAAVIGGGAFGEVHLQHYACMPQVEVAGVYTLEAARGEELCRKYGGKNYSSLESLAGDGSVDLVSVATPEDAHGEALAALAAEGKAVYVEKPLATSLREAQRMVELSRNIPAMSGHLLRFEARYERIFRKMKECGALRHLTFRRLRNRGQKAVYGRVHLAHCMLSHDVDLCNWYVGVPFRRVCALETDFSGEEAPDHIAVMVEYENGVTASLEAGWLLPDGAGTMENDMAVVATDDGVFEMSLPHAGLRFFSQTGIQAPNVAYDSNTHGVEYGPLRGALDYMVACVIAGKKPEISTMEDGCRAVELIVAALLSVREGRWVRREELNASD